MKKVLIVLLILGLAVPAAAAEWNLFGSARMSTFWLDQDGGDNDDVDDEGLLHYLQGGSRIGASVKASDMIGGYFEYGTGVDLRELYGTYNFGGGELLVGQTYTPTSNFFYSNSVFDDDGDLLGIGQFYVGRTPMIQLTMGTFKVALVSPTAGFAPGGYDEDVTLPKIEASYSFKTDVFFADVFGGFQTYELEDADEDTIDVTAYTVGLGLGGTFGPLKLAVAGNYGQNFGAYGAYNPTFGRPDNVALPIDPVLDGDDVEDTTIWQAIFVATFIVNDNLALEAGVGYATSENDLVDESDEQMQYYVNAVVNIAPGFFIVPEAGIIDWMENAADEDQGRDFYAGLKWQIDF